MSVDKLTPAEATKIGKDLRNAADGNMVVGSFAAEMIGESYPFSKAMSAIVFKGWSDEALGQKFAEWQDSRETQRNGSMNTPSPTQGDDAKLAEGIEDAFKKCYGSPMPPTTYIAFAEGYHAALRHPHQPQGGGFAYSEADKALTAALPKFAIFIEPRPDGGIRISSNDLPGLILSADNPHKCLSTVWHAVLALAEQGSPPEPLAALPSPQAAGVGALKGDLFIFMEGDTYNVSEFYRRKGFAKLPPSPSLSGAQIMEIADRDSTYRLFCDDPWNESPREISLFEAVPLISGMKFYATPPCFGSGMTENTVAPVKSLDWPELHLRYTRKDFKVVPWSAALTPLPAEGLTDEEHKLVQEGLAFEKHHFVYGSFVHKLVAIIDRLTKA
jgi:hypothetical protein